MAAAAACVLQLASAADARAANATADCVDLGQPKPTTTYVFRRRESNGHSSQYSQRWTVFTRAQSSVSVARAPVTETVVNQHKIQDDVTMISSTTMARPGGAARTTFRTAVVGDPLFRACAGRSWKIAAVVATHTEQGRVSTADTYAGLLRIVALRETIQVPAGTFECVHYMRTQQTPAGPSVDEYWKSIEHGVVVRQVSRLAGWSSTADLISIR
jgi:hypothetical protein